MSIPLIAEITPQNGGAFAMLDDEYLRGSLRAVADHAARDAITSDRRKQGMLVFTQNDSLTWQLGSDLATWTQFSSGSSGGVVGPGSSVDDDIALFSGTTGALIKDSGVLVASLATTTALASETTARSSADTTLQTNITSEATTRASADTALAAEIAAIVPFGATGKVIVAVDGSSGVDRTVSYINGDFTSSPFLTIQSAIASLPVSSAFRRLVKVNANASAYAGFNASGFQGAGDVVISFATSSPTLTGPASGAAAAGSTTTTCNLPTGSGTNWASDTLRGLFIQVANSSDSDIPYKRPIKSKTNTSFTFDAIPGFTSGTSFAIVKAGASLAAGASYGGLNIGAVLTFNSAPIKTEYLAPAASLDYGIYSTGNALSEHHGAQFENAANFQTFWSSSDLCSRLNDSYMSAGNTQQQNGATAEFQNNVSDGGYSLLQANSVLVQFDAASVTAGIPLIVQRSNSVLIGANVASCTASAALVFDSCTSVVQKGAGLTGTGNSGYGVEVSRCTSVDMSGASITGTSGDFSIDGSTAVAQTWVQLASSKAMSRYGAGTLLLGGSTAAEVYIIESVSINGANFDVAIAQEQHGGRVINYGYFHFSFPPGADGVIAHAGGGQSGAAAISTGATSFTTVASDHDSCILNFAAIGGMAQLISNLGAHILDVFPVSGGKIDSGSINAAVSLDPGTSAIFLSRSNGTDYLWL